MSVYTAPHLRSQLIPPMISSPGIRIWLAHWVDQTNYSGAYGIWQYSEKGKVAGISGNVDLDICYKDFPTTIKSKGLNGFGKAPAPAEEKSEDKPDTAVTATIKIGNDTYKGTLVKA